MSQNFSAGSKRPEGEASGFLKMSQNGEGSFGRFFNNLIQNGYKTNNGG